MTICFKQMVIITSLNKHLLFVFSRQLVYNHFLSKSVSKTNIFLLFEEYYFYKIIKGSDDLSKQSNQRYRKELSKKQSSENKVSNSYKDESNQNSSNGKMNTSTNRSDEDRSI